MPTHTHVRTIHQSLTPEMVSLILPITLGIAASIAANIYIPDYAKYYYAAFALWLVIRAFKILLRMLGSAYTIYTDVVTSRVGIIARNISQVRIADIRGMTISQSIIGRMLNYGNVIIGTAATGEAEIIMRGVSSPASIIAEIDSLR